MSTNLSNSEILNLLLQGQNLDDITSRSLMQRWLNDEILDVQTGAFLSAFWCFPTCFLEVSVTNRCFRVCF